MIDYVRELIPKSLDLAISILVALVVLVVGLRLINKLLRVFRNLLTKKELEPGLISFLISAGRILLYVVLIFAVAQILGFATSSIVAVVGSAGLAIGLALQGSLANFAGGVLLLLMKPFVVGDYIIVGDVEGTVKKIDVVYTTLGTNDNRAVILPNGKLADSNIINATREDRRRVDIYVDIEYNEDVKRVRRILKEIVDRQDTRLEEMDTDIVVYELGESSIKMGVRFWVRPDDYWSTRFQVLEQIKEDFDRNHIVIPFRQMDVHVRES